jgi:hypothetical protein
MEKEGQLSGWIQHDDGVDRAEVFRRGGVKEPQLGVVA